MQKEEKSQRTSYFVVLAATMAATAGLLFGFDTGNIAGALIFIKNEFHTSTIQNELIVSITLLGAFVGAIASGKLVEIFGRRFILLMTAWIFIIGASIAALANSITMLVVGRLFLGLAIGASSYTAPLYIAEISPAKYRGPLFHICMLKPSVIHISIQNGRKLRIYP